MLYVALGHRIANVEGDGSRLGGIDRLGASMLIAAVVAASIGMREAIPAFTHPYWLLVGIAIGVCSSVIPYVTDQLAMARIPRPTFALMLAILPASATLIGAIVRNQFPSLPDVGGIALVILGVGLHSPRET